jgi:hypothetical protein
MTSSEAPLPARDVTDVPELLAGYVAGTLTWPSWVSPGPRAAVAFTDSGRRRLPSVQEGVNGGNRSARVDVHVPAEPQGNGGRYVTFVVVNEHRLLRHDLQGSECRLEDARRWLCAAEFTREDDRRPRRRTAHAPGFGHVDAAMRC